MIEDKRFVSIDYEEVYYITDTKNLETLDDYIKEFSKAEYEFTEEEALSVAKEEYWQMIYENSMTANENADMLNQLNNEVEELKNDNDIKFWKLQFMKQHHDTQVILHELKLAIQKGHVVSDKFQQYCDEIMEEHQKLMDKAERLEI